MAVQTSRDGQNESNLDNEWKLFRFFRHAVIDTY